MKRLEFEVLVDIEDSALDSFDTDFGKEELKDVIESELHRYLRDECLGDTNKFKLNIDCVKSEIKIIDWKECSKEVPTKFGGYVLVACRNKNKEDGIWLYDLIQCWEGKWEPRDNWENPIKWAYL